VRADRFLEAKVIQWLGAGSTSHRLTGFAGRSADGVRFLLAWTYT
jgi:hypothetical protein